MKLSGTAYFKVDGVAYSIAGSITISLGNTQRESLVGHDGYHGIKEMPAVPSMEVQFRDFSNIDLNVLERATDVTVTAELISGKVGILRNATQVNKLELNSEDGTYTVRFEGPKGEWITA